MNGFNILQTLSKGSYCNDHKLSNVSERGRRYLKTKYALNCSEESEIAISQLSLCLIKTK